MRHHYRAGFEWYDTDLDEGTALLHRLLAAAERPTGPDPRAVRAAGARRDRRRPRRARARSRRSTTSPSAILSGGDDPTAPAVLRELGALLGVDLDAGPIASPTR